MVLSAQPAPKLRFQITHRNFTEMKSVSRTNSGLLIKDFRQSGYGQKFATELNQLIYLPKERITYKFLTKKEINTIKIVYPF